MLWPLPQNEPALSRKMSDDEASISKDASKAILLTKDGQRYFVGDSRSVDSRDVITLIPMEAADLMDLDDADEESDVLDASDPREGAGSPEDLNDDDASEGDGAAPKPCTYDGCTETTTQVAKQRKPWMCKKHRNKMYKDKYKKKKSDQAMSTNKIDDNCEERPVSVNKQRLGAMGDRPARPSLIEQVLNQKRLSLLRSPEVIHFLQQQQHILAAQSRSLALPHNFSGC